MEMHEQLTNECELTGKQAEEIVAGKDNRDTRTLMRCDECGWEIAWAGDYMNGHIYDCPMCHAHAYHGIRYC